MQVINGSGVGGVSQVQVTSLPPCQLHEGYHSVSAVDGSSYKGGVG